MRLTAVKSSLMMGQVKAKLSFCASRIGVNILKVLAIFITFLLLPALIGCGSDAADTPAALGVAAVLENVVPKSGSTLAVNGSIALTFNKRPENVRIDSGHPYVFADALQQKRLYGLSAVHHADRTLLILGPFTTPVSVINVSWGTTLPQETLTLTYTVTMPDCCGSLQFAGGTVKDGDTDVDPELIHSDGVMEMHFTGEVTGSIRLETEAGEDVGWIGTVEGHKGILELVKGRELRNETTYVIIAKVVDTAGNEYTFQITFTTRAKV